MRLAVVSPFLDRSHGTELCIIEQLERFASQFQWEIHLYAQRVEDMHGVQIAGASAKEPGGSIFWHRISRLPGPHLFQYIWWFCANSLERKFNRRTNKVCPELTYSPGINCFDADVIVVHIVFHEFYSRVREELRLSHWPLKSWPRVIHRRLYYKLIMALERRIYPNPEVRLIAVSQLVANQLQAFFLRSDAVVIPNAVDTDRFTPAARTHRRAASRERLEIRPEEFVCLLIGNDWKKKGLDTLLEAIQSLRELPLRLLVVGKDSAAGYQSLLRKLGFEDRVLFLPPSSDVLFFYAAADLYVGPSLEDAFGLPIVEAMACGLPVIASVRAGASDLVHHGETGLLLLDPRSPEELAKQIHRYYTDEQFRNSVGQSASKYVQENCSWNFNASRTREFLEAALVDGKYRQ